MPADIIQKIFVNAGATADDVAAIDVPADGFIESIFWHVRGTGMDALDDTVRFELSFGSSSTFNTNDSRISILDVSVTQQFLTSGGGVQGESGFMGNVNIPVFAGERIHVHYTESGTPSSGTFHAYLYYSARGAAPRRSTRRR